MNIDPSVIVTQMQNQVSTGKPAPNPADVEAFAAAMAARPPKPERALVEGIHKAELGVARKVDDLGDRNPTDAVEMGKLQAIVHGRRTEVEVYAKVAGLISSAVTKITTMQ